MPQAACFLAVSNLNLVLLSKQNLIPPAPPVFEQKGMNCSFLTNVSWAGRPCGFPLSESLIESALQSPMQKGAGSLPNLLPPWFCLPGKLGGRGGEVWIKSVFASQPWGWVVCLLLLALMFGCAKARCRDGEKPVTWVLSLEDFGYMHFHSYILFLLLCKCFLSLINDLGYLEDWQKQLSAFFLCSPCINLFVSKICLLMWCLVHSLGDFTSSLQRKFWDLFL